MEDFPIQKITIYHKNENNRYEKYVKDASIRNNSMLNHKKYGFSEKDRVVIRIFDVQGYNKNIHIKNTSTILNFALNSFLGDTWQVKQGDIIVNGYVEDEIQTTSPNTDLSEKYGKENVFKVNSINILIFDDNDIKELNHLKLGCI